MRWFIILAILPCCASEPSASDRTSNQIIATEFDPAADFGSFRTFAINPVVSTVGDVPDLPMLQQAANDLVVNEVVANLTARGYRRVDLSAQPDLGVNAAVITLVRTESSATTTGFYWTFPGFTTSAFWGLPSFNYTSSWTYVSLAFKSSTLVIQMADLRTARSLAAVLGAVDSVAPAMIDAGTVIPIDAGALNEAGQTGTLNVVWSAFLHGFVAFGGTLVPEIPAAIDQAFAQSPYLKAK